MGKFAVPAAWLAIFPVACAHGIDTGLDLSSEDGGTGTGQTTGPMSSTGTGGGSGASTTSGSAGRGDPTGVGGSGGSGGLAGTTSSAGGSGGSSGATGATTGGGGSAGAGPDGGSAGGQAGSAGQAGSGGSGGAGGAGGTAGSAGTGGSGGNGGVVVRDAGPLSSFDDAVTGTGTNQFNYVGTWGHCAPCTSSSTPPLHNTSNSWAGGVDAAGTEYMTFTFVGSELHFYGVKDPRNGIAKASIDGGAETNVDFYSATRAGNTLLWSSPVLADGSHTFKLRVTSTKNASSAGTTITVDRVDVR